MSLAAGARLGAYEIVGSIGAGGMGEVYRARDPRLGRDVAIKVLPATFAEDAVHVRRFEKEARAGPRSPGSFPARRWSEISRGSTPRCWETSRPMARRSSSRRPGKGAGRRARSTCGRPTAPPLSGWGRGLRSLCRPTASGRRCSPPTRRGRRSFFSLQGPVAKQLSIEPLTERGGVSWFPDSKRFVVCGTEPGHKPRCYVVDVKTGKTRPLTPEGVRGAWPGGAPVSPDGRSLLVRDARDASVEKPAPAVYSLEAGELQPLRGWTGGWAPKWSADGRAILVHTFEFEWPSATWLVRFDLAKGVPEKLRKLTIADRVGAFDLPVPVITPDGKYYAYQQSRQLCDLYLVDGLR